MAARRSKSALRTLADPFVIAAPSGVRTRTRVHPTGDEEAALVRIGTHLGALYRSTLVSRIALGAADRERRNTWRAERKRALTADSSSRWAGAITRTAEDGFQLGLRALSAHEAQLSAAISAIQARMDIPVGTTHEDPERPRARPIRGYRSEQERFQKPRRRAQLADSLRRVRERIAHADPRIVCGGAGSGGPASTSPRRDSRETRGSAGGRTRGCSSPRMGRADGCLATAPSGSRPRVSSR